MSELVTILGKVYTMDEARDLWFALGEIFGMGSTMGCWNLVPAEDQAGTMKSFCPCEDCRYLGIA
jgi:hypothetical protein